MAAYSATLRGASVVYVVDRVPERLQVAEKIGCVGIDFSEGDAVKMIIEKNGGMVDRAVDAVGYQAVGSGKGNEEEVPNVVLEQLIQVTRPTGGLGIPGLYVPSAYSYRSLHLILLIIQTSSNPLDRRSRRSGREERKGDDIVEFRQTVREGQFPFLSPSKAL